MAGLTVAEWVVGNNERTKWRGWGPTGPRWVSDPEEAVRFARRQDAEAVFSEDEDVWCITTLEALRRQQVRLFSFQARVALWMEATFGPEISADRLERNDRFIEEALELVQATEYPKERAHELVEYVYGRPKGEVNQEIGGVMVTLAAHCLAHGLDMHTEAERELTRIWTKVDQIRAK